MDKTAVPCGRDLVTFDILMLASGAVLYAANNALVKPLCLPGVLGAFFGGHFNDMVAGFAFLAYTNILFDLVRPSRRLERLWVMLLYMLGCGLFWEIIAPAIFKPSVTDPWDIVSYLAGACIYWAANVVHGRHA